MANLATHCRCMIIRAQGGALVEMPKEPERVQRFIEAFEKLCERKPRPKDAEGNFTIYAKVALFSGLSILEPDNIQDQQRNNIREVVFYRFPMFQKNHCIANLISMNTVAVSSQNGRS